MKDLPLRRRNVLIAGAAVASGALIGCEKDPPPPVVPQPKIPAVPVVDEVWHYEDEGSSAERVTEHRPIIGYAPVAPLSEAVGKRTALADMMRLVGVDGYRGIRIERVTLGGCRFYRATATPVSATTRAIVVSARRDIRPWAKTEPVERAS
jgi:hypothetical protein